MQFTVQRPTGSTALAEVLVGVSYRLTPETGEHLLGEFPEAADDLRVERINWKAPFPVIRQDFGLPTVQATEEGITRIADAHALDFISLGIDQNAQASFFHPEMCLLAWCP
jgi:hypothetical protein